MTHIKFVIATGNEISVYVSELAFSLGCKIIWIAFSTVPIIEKDKEVMEDILARLHFSNYVTM